MNWHQDYTYYIIDLFFFIYCFATLGWTVSDLRLLSWKEEERPEYTPFDDRKCVSPVYKLDMALMSLSVFILLLNFVKDLELFGHLAISTIVSSTNLGGVVDIFSDPEWQAKYK